MFFWKYFSSYLVSRRFFYVEKVGTSLYGKTAIIIGEK